MASSSIRRLHSSPFSPPPLLVLRLLFTACLVSFVPCRTSATSLSSIELLVDLDRISALGLSDVIQAYQLVQPNVTFTTNIQTSQPNIADVASDSVDFAMISTGLTTAQATLYPQLQAFPVMCSSVVPIYRLSALGSTTLVLSRQALAGIYAGRIVWWNDTAIQSTNSVTVPSLPIRVVYESDLSAVNSIFLTALHKFQPGFPVATSSTPTWPLTSYAAVGSGTGVTGVSAAVLTVDGSIGYAPQSNALAAGVSVASMINWANQTVAAVSSTITAAITEVSSGYTTLYRQTLQLDYTDGHGAMSWPIPILTSLLIDLVNSRSTCHQRAAVVDFWLWYYTSSIPEGLLAPRRYATVPAFLQSQIDPVSVLQSSVLCRGSPALSTVSASSRTVSTSTATTLLSTLFSQAYLSVDETVDWQSQTNDDELVLDQLLNAEVDLGFFVPGQCSDPQSALIDASCCHSNHGPLMTAPLAVNDAGVCRERRLVTMAAGGGLRCVPYSSSLPHRPGVVVSTQQLTPLPTHPPSNHAGSPTHSRLTLISLSVVLCRVRIHCDQLQSRGLQLADYSVKPAQPRHPYHHYDLLFVHSLVQQLGHRRTQPSLRCTAQRY